MRRCARFNRLACLAAACLGLGLATGRTAEEAPRDTGGTMLSSLNIRDLTMGEFAALLSHSGVMQVVASEEAAAKSISAYLRGVPAHEALEAVCRGAGLVCRPNWGGGVTYVFTQREFSASRGLYNDEVVETVQLRHASAPDVGETLRNLFADRVVWIQPSNDLGNPEAVIENALKRMDRLTDYEEFGRGGGTGGGTGSGSRDRYARDRDSRDRYDQNSDQDSRERDGMWNIGLLEQSRTLLRQDGADRAPVASGMADKGRDDARFGIVFVSAFPSTNTLLMRSTDARAIAQIRTAVTELDRPTPQVLLEVKVLELALGDGEAIGVDWLVQAGDVYGGGSNWGNGSIGNPPTETLGGGVETATVTHLTGATGFNPRTAVVGVLSEHLLARIRLMQSEGRLVQVASPTLLVANDEASRVFIGSQSKFLKEVKRSAVVVSEGGQTTGGDLDPELEELSIGMNLLINPRIHADRSVTLRVLQEETGFGEMRVIDYGEGTLEVQDVLHRSVVSTIVAHDGNWVVIGGLIRESVSKVESGVPVLRDIPLLGRAFTSTGKSRTRTELVVLIRPVVLLAPGEEGLASWTLLERLSRHPSASRADLPSLGVDLPTTETPEPPTEMSGTDGGDQAERTP